MNSPPRKYIVVFDFNGTLANDQRHLPDFDHTWDTPEQVLTHMPLFKEAVERWVNMERTNIIEPHILTALSHRHRPFIVKAMNAALAPYGLSITEDRVHTFPAAHLWSPPALIDHKREHLVRLRPMIHIADSDGKPDHNGGATKDYDLVATQQANKMLAEMGLPLIQFFNAHEYRTF